MKSIEQLRKYIPDSPKELFNLHRQPKNYTMKTLLFLLLLISNFCFAQLSPLDYTPPDADNLKQAAIKINANETYLDLKIDTAKNRIDSLIDAGNSVYYLEDTVSAAELQTIQATPMELISAPGSGRGIFIIDGYIIQKSVSVDYATGGNFVLKMGTKDMMSIGSLRQASSFPKSFLQRVENHLLNDSYIEDAYDNKALMLANSSSISSDGDGYLIIRLYYKIITVN